MPRNTYQLELRGKPRADDSVLGEGEVLRLWSGAKSLSDRIGSKIVGAVTSQKAW